MPCPGYGISPSRCNVGSKLAEVKGSVCSDCYACKGMYRFKNTQNAHERRYQSLSQPRWVEMMSFVISRKNLSHFRWHDAGDLQGMWHLEKIVEVVNNTPNCQHWLPTKEAALIQKYKKQVGEFPANLVVRVSSPIIDMRPLKGYDNTSTVHRSLNPHGYACPAYEADGKCGSCRACWDKKISNVSYKNH